MNMSAENIVVIYHAHCPDGFGAAYAAWKTLGPSAGYIPLPNGTSPPELDPATRIYILDLSFSRDRMLELHQRHGADNVMVLDHHVSAQRSIGDLPNCHFDMARSGAIIAWEHFHPDQPTPTLLGYVQDCDLWRWELDRSRAVSAYIASVEHDFDQWDRTALEMAADPEPIFRAGEAIERFNRISVERLVVNHHLVTIGDHQVPAVNSPMFNSDIGEALLQRFPEAPFVAIYSNAADGEQRWSLRSRTGEFDVSQLASQMGGGGHQPAAGFVQRFEPVRVSPPAQP